MPAKTTIMKKEHEEGQHNDANALYELGMIYARGKGGIQSYEQAVSYFFEAAKMGHHDAMLRVAEASYLGLGTHKNRSTANLLYHGEKQPEEDLFVWNHIVDVIEYDEKKSFHDYILAAHNGQTEAQKYLMFVYSDVELTRDYKASVYWAEQLANNGDVTGACRLAGAYIRGLGVEKNYAKAREILLKAQQIEPGSLGIEMLFADLNIAEKQGI